jgi:hypothetical protein
MKIQILQIPDCAEKKFIQNKIFFQQMLYSVELIGIFAAECSI